MEKRCIYIYARLFIHMSDMYACLYNDTIIANMCFAIIIIIIVIFYYFYIGAKFVSFRKVAYDMDAFKGDNALQMISFHSTSKVYKKRFKKIRQKKKIKSWNKKSVLENINKIIEKKTTHFRNMKYFFVLICLFSIIFFLKPIIVIIVIFICWY